MTKRSICVGLALLICLTQAGCWDRREVESLGIVNGLAIDLAGEQRERIIVQTVNSAALAKNSGGGGASTFEKPYRNIQSEGDSLYEAIKNLEHTTSTQRFFAHTDVVIVSENYARNRGMQDILDYLSRDPEWRYDVWLLVGRGDMASLMDTKGTTNPIPAQRIAEILRLNNSISNYAPIRLGEFLKIMSSESSHPYTTIVDAQPNAAQANEEGHDILNGAIPEPESDLVVKNTAVFKKDKMIGWLSEQESRGLLFIRDDIKAGEIKFPNPQIAGKTISTEILRSKTEIKPEIINNQLIIHINVEVASVLEAVEGKTPVSKYREVKVLEEGQKIAVTRSIEAVLAKAQQEYQVDIFGFGEAVHRKYPGVWKDMKAAWSDIFPTIPTVINVTSSIRHTNLSSNPPGVKK